MPSISAPATVLVTGASGFVAVWIVRDLLERGFNVRGTVRDAKKGEYLKKVFKSYADSGKFEFVIVGNMIEPGSFDEAIKGVDAIAHTASPFHFDGGAVKDLVDPAVKGTVEILESALKHGGQQLKRVIVLSSTASVAPLIPTREATLTEADWNTEDVGEVETKGDDAHPVSKYSYSKVLAERAAWAFYDKHKQEITWDLLTLCPPEVFGPILHDVSSPTHLNTSVKRFYYNVVKDTGDPKRYAAPGSGWVDVRDVALAHVRALERDDAAGNRFIIASGILVWQDFFDATNALQLADVSAPIGTPGAGKSVKYMFVYDTTKAQKVLGIEFRDCATTTKDTLASFRERGWLNN